MERKDFLKSACRYSLCGCVGLSFLGGGEALANSQSASAEGEPDWRIDFMQSRYRDLLYILNDTLDDETFIKALNKLGAKCGDDFANKYEKSRSC